MTAVLHLACIRPDRNIAREYVFAVDPDGRDLVTGAHRIGATWNTRSREFATTEERNIILGREIRAKLVRKTNPYALVTADPFYFLFEDVPRVPLLRPGTVPRLIWPGHRPSWREHQTRFDL